MANVKLVSLDQQGAKYRVEIEGLDGYGEFVLKRERWPDGNVLDSDHFWNLVHLTAADLRRMCPDHQIKEEEDAGEDKGSVIHAQGANIADLDTERCRADDSKPSNPEPSAPEQQDLPRRNKRDVSKPVRV